MKKIFVLSCENNAFRTWYAEYVLLNVEIKEYDIMINGRNLLDQPVKNDAKTYKNIRKFATGQGDDYITGCLLDYFYFKEVYMLIVADLRKQQVLDADPKAIQQINFTGNLEEAGSTAMFFIFEEVKETTLDFLQGTVSVL